LLPKRCLIATVQRLFTCELHDHQTPGAINSLANGMDVIKQQLRAKYAIIRCFNYNASSLTPLSLIFSIINKRMMLFQKRQ
jgi:hypothetical protein